ncbi:hypothetical protein [Sphingobium sp. HWE2-09]|uniref:hypothetical protein n=1 Tax=Sphingobium sp. HWE2-09 TaxID=3108390 RepID=UPI002DD1E75D|nr:hypothetical protein [Sphingobium sp. HWE2-09]
MNISCQLHTQVIDLPVAAMIAAVPKHIASKQDDPHLPHVPLGRFTRYDERFKPDRVRCCHDDSDARTNPTSACLKLHSAFRRLFCGAARHGFAVRRPFLRSKNHTRGWLNKYEAYFYYRRLCVGRSRAGSIGLPMDDADTIFRTNH